MSTSEERKLRIEKTAMTLSFAGSLIIAVAELFMFFVTRSHSILIDAVFDGVDLILIGPFLVLIPLLYKPVTEDRPYGYSQFESLFMVLKYGALLVVTVFLIAENVQLIFRGGHLVDAADISGFELAVGAICVTVFAVLRHLGKKYSSMILEAELYVWKVDVFGSFAVALAFGMQLLLKGTRYEWLEPYFDPAVAILMSCILIRKPAELIHRNLRQMLLLAPPEEVMEEVRQVCTEELAVYEYELDFLDVIQTGRKTWVECYVDSEGFLLDLRKLHAARNRIRGRLRERFDMLYIELIPAMNDK
ncbi:cation diffusion facilitator family transporter [Lachnoclostridium sp. Marseille-P6806]|uniref:cation diffusion facilitator family transporter n=1 Tax=Lachnoclostridium sp. Marseille-P6806 TaxID=2364793 RepID=UPI00102F874C|nr:cation diffusion facilitator family transporter [Lachnoclostridium sp. Marseille-P6806]